MLKCDVWLIISKKIKNQKKLSFRSIKCKLFDYRRINQYRLYNSIFRRIVTIKNVIFDESSMLNRKSRAYHWDDDYECFMSENFVHFENFKKSNEFTSSDNNDDYDQSKNFVQQIARLKTEIKRLSLSKTKKSIIMNDDFRVSSLREKEKMKNINNVDENDRVLHSNFHSNSTMIEISSRRSIKKKLFSKKQRLNQH